MIENYFFFRIVKKLKIACVEYINTFPFIYGLENSSIKDHLSIYLETPSKCKERFQAGDVDIALVPVAGLTELVNFSQFSDYCIGCKGAVKTVSIFSNANIASIDRIYLDSDSLTSAQLVKYLMKHYWRRTVEYVNCNVKNLQITDREAVLMIGDKAFDSYKTYSYQYDLGEYWYRATNLPFVFAVWLAQNDISSEVKTMLNEAFSIGIQQLNKVIETYQTQFPDKNLEEYYSKYISYDLDSSKRQAQNMFLESVKSRQSRGRLSAI